ncbi:MAG: cyanophycin synthetase [Sphaerobacteraceae bacterium]|nr:MAG: cyanophycin synthetase [Sphaerobacteraceae bacterium]
MPLKILESQIYRGPNVWARVPVIRLKVDLEDLEERPSNTVDGFYDELNHYMPSLYDHYCSMGRRGGFLERIQEGTWMGHIAEHIALELQTIAGSEVGRGLTRSTGEYGIYNVVYQYIQPDLGMEAGKLAIRFVNWLVYKDDPEFNFEEELEELILLAERLAYGPSTKALVEEAERRGIPVIRLDPSRSLVQMGYGVYQQRIWATVTSETSDIAVDIAGNKRLTNQLLQGVGIPVPLGGPVRTFEEALSVARRIGYPIVMKPMDGNHGRGVQINLQNDEDVAKSFRLAQDESRSGYVMVESFVVGRDYRILVVGGQMIACSERVPAHVIGDGSHTIAELIEITNSDPRRGIGHEKVLTRIPVNQSVINVLERNDQTLETIPENGEFVQLQLTGNMSTGGISRDRTNEIHPDNIEIAEQAARIIGLDVAGIDIIANDIATPLKDQAGAICEVNAGPGFRMHTHPTEGDPQDVARPVLDTLFPEGARSRIPITAVTGTNGKTTTCRMIAHIVKMSGRRVGLTTTDGIYIDGTQILKGDMSGPQSAQMVLQNPTVEHAVLETARGGIVRSGLGFDRCDVSVVTNVTGDHLGIGGVDTIDQLADIKAVVPAATWNDGYSVLNADDEWCRKMERRARGEIIYFSMDENNETVRSHLRSRGIAVFLRKRGDSETICLAEGKRETTILDVLDIPATFEGRARVNVKNALAATAAAYASNISLPTIRTGLRSFSTSFFHSPGRLNLLEAGGYRVIVDYCHNVAGMRELTDFVHRLKPSRSIAMISMPGDRRDEDILKFGALAADAFDELVIREDHHLRGRDVGEVAKLLSKAVLENGYSEDQITIVLDELEATNSVMDRASQDDLIVLLADRPEEVWNAVVQRAQSRKGD